MCIVTYRQHQWCISVVLLVSSQEASISHCVVLLDSNSPPEAPNSNTYRLDQTICDVM